MKHYSKIGLKLMALACCLVMVGTSALATSPENMNTLMEQFKTLAFDTQNVTLGAEADFYWDGQLFKHFEGEHKQNGYDSLMKVSLSTPKKDGTTYVGSYTVYGQDNMAFAIDSITDEYYSVRGNARSDSVVRKTSLRMAAFDVLSQLTGYLSDHLTIQPKGATYAFSMSKDETPKLANSVITYLALKRIQQQGYDNDNVAAACTVQYEDWEALFALWYQQLTGEPMPKDFYYMAASANASEADRTLYQRVSTELSGHFYELANQHETGILLAHADGTDQWYETFNDYLRAHETDYLAYENFEETFLAYYQQKTGETLTLEQLHAINYSGNAALQQAQTDMVKEMEQAYRASAAADPNAIGVYVYANGKTELFNDADSFHMIDETVARCIMRTFASAQVEVAEMLVSTDAQGRISGVQGELAFQVKNRMGEEHQLRISFTCTAKDYGTTAFDRFDPDKSGILSAEEYYNRLSEAASVNDMDDGARDAAATDAGTTASPTVTPAAAPTTVPTTVPKTIRFNGQEYTLE
ncbi:MAG: hypothetical protein RR521_05625 [Clostridia bacterium]